MPGDLFEQPQALQIQICGGVRSGLCVLSWKVGKLLSFITFFNIDALTILKIKINSEQLYLPGPLTVKSFSCLYWLGQSSYAIGRKGHQMQNRANYNYNDIAGKRFFQ